MKIKNSLGKRFVIHPVLWAAYPILATIAYNLGEVVIPTTYRSLIFAILLAVLLLVFFRLIMRDWHKAGLIATTFVLLFFSYGHIYSLVEDVIIQGIVPGRHRTLGILWLGLFLAVLISVWRTRANLSAWTQILNIVGVLMIAIPLIQWGFFSINSQANLADANQRREHFFISSKHSDSISLPDQPPDVYYIILDAYTRDDTLKTVFNYDNEPFLQSLKDMGFYVAKCSQSNYAGTQLSLTSTLNMVYLDQIDSDLKKVTSSPVLNYHLLNNQVQSLFDQLGYQTVVVESGYSPTEWTNADQYLSLQRDLSWTSLFGGLNDFESLILQTSGGSLIYAAKPYLSFKVWSFLDTAYNLRRNRILYAFEQLEAIPQQPGPKFVFVHILAPHEPFVFGPKGQYIGRETPLALNNDPETKDPDIYRRGYRGQINYLNTRIAPLIEGIIRDSDTPPVIILQGDHGPVARIASPAGRMTILNAYYFPGGEDYLYDSITPVNTFRLLLNTYFDGNYELLEDQSFYSTSSKRYDMTFMPNLRVGCDQPQTP